MSSSNQTNLAGVTSGMFKVTTQDSSYLVDYDTKRAKRNPGDEAREMSKDREWFGFISVVAEVGSAMFIWTSDVDEIDATFTNRRTSLVTRIECLTECGI